MFGRSNPDKELKERLKKPITIEVPFKALCSGKPKSEYFTEPPFKYDRVELLIDDKLVISAEPVLHTRVTGENGLAIYDGEGQFSGMVGCKVFYETQYVVEQKVPLELKCKLDKGQLYFSDFFQSDLACLY